LIFEVQTLIVTVGGANGERIISIKPEEFSLGKKHTSSAFELTAGGSAVNHACRLMAMGVCVCPVLPVGSDQVGQLIIDVLEAAAKAGGVGASFGDVRMKPVEAVASFGCPSEGVLTTPFSTILQIGPSRSVFNETNECVNEAFVLHCQRRLKHLLNRCAPQIKAMMVGHIQADKEGAEGNNGSLTELIINKCSERKIPLFLNLGRSQYAQGAKRWASLLEKVTLFQLDIDEVRLFANDLGLTKLSEIFDWFSSKCTLVVTMERMGAIARLKGSNNIIIAWPYDLDADEIKDSTGAGDAFAAGVVKSATLKPLVDDNALSMALELGRECGAYACTKVGGAAFCPTTDELKRFKENHSCFLETEIKEASEASAMLKIFDRVFVRG
jgi:sugar/nucleoside kinase (ribokinase family)